MTSATGPKLCPVTMPHIMRKLLILNENRMNFLNPGSSIDISVKNLTMMVILAVQIQTLKNSVYQILKQISVVETVTGSFCEILFDLLGWAKLPQIHGATGCWISRK